MSEAVLAAQQPSQLFLVDLERDDHARGLLRLFAEAARGPCLVMQGIRCLRTSEVGHAVLGRGRSAAHATCSRGAGKL